MPELPQRRLGRTGLMVTALGLGAMDTEQSPEGAETLHTALDLGINFIDTAREYAGSEFLLGQVRYARGAQDFFVATKTFERTADGAQRDVDRSLSMLGVEAVDLYQLHDIRTLEVWEQVMAADGALEGLQAARERGLVRHIGVSTHNLEVLERAITCGEFETVMLEYSAFYPETTDLITLAHDLDVGVIVMRPLGGSGRTSVIRGRIAEGYDGPLTPANLLRYTWSHPGVSTSIAGVRFAAHVRDNVATALDATPLDDAARRALEEEARRLY